MPNIPYPEFNDFHLELARKVVQGSQPVEGFAFLSMNSLPNCVRGMNMVPAFGFLARCPSLAVAYAEQRTIASSSTA